MIDRTIFPPESGGSVPSPAAPQASDGAAPQAPSEAAPICRRRLSTTRPHLTRVFRFPPEPEKPGEDFTLGIGFEPGTGIVSEVFLRGYKQGSDQDTQLDNFCILVSHLLQCGYRAADLCRKISNGRPADQIMSYILALAAEEDPQPVWWRMRRTMVPAP